MLASLYKLSTDEPRSRCKKFRKPRGFWKGMRPARAYTAYWSGLDYKWPGPAEGFPISGQRVFFVMKRWMKASLSHNSRISGYLQPPLRYESHCDEVTLANIAILTA